MKLTKRSFAVLSALLFASAVLSSAYAQELTGYDIAKRSHEVPEGETSAYKATMTLTSKKGKSRVREVLMRSKDYGDTKKSVIYFVTPKDVAGVSYLSFEYDDKPDGTSPDSDNWLYMPAMKKVRRISGSGKSDDFMGTDFTYEDIGERSLTKDSYTLLGEETVGGADCWKVEAVSKDGSEKDPRRVTWIRKDNYLPQKAEFYDRQNTLHRELLCEGIRKIDGYWTTTKMTMRNVQTGHSTVIEMKDVFYDIAMDDSMFTVSSLQKGKIK